MYDLEKSDSCAFPDYSEDSTCYVAMWKRQLFADDTNITHCVKSERAAVNIPSGSCHILHTVCRPAVFDKRMLLIGGATPDSKNNEHLLDGYWHVLIQRLCWSKNCLSLYSLKERRLSFIGVVWAQSWWKTGNSLFNQKYEAKFDIGKIGDVQNIQFPRKPSLWNRRNH